MKDTQRGDYVYKDIYPLYTKLITEYIHRGAKVIMYMMIYIHRSNYVYNDIYPLYTKVVMFTMIYIHRGDYIYTGQSTPLTPTGI